MIASTFKTITQEHIREVVTREIWHRGYNYFKHNAVLSLNHNDYTISASVRGTANYPYQVHIVESDQQISHTSCTCPYSSRWGWVCKHIVAVLLAWIHQRDSLYYPSASEYTGSRVQDNSPANVVALKPLNPLYGILSSWFPLSEHVQVSVDLENEGPKLKITLLSETNKRTAVLIVPEDESPDMLQRLRSIRDVSFSRNVAGTRFIRNRASHELMADYDEQDRLVLTPGYRIKDENGKQTIVTRDDANHYRINDRWLWFKNAYIMIEQMPEEFSPYINGGKPLVYAGTAIVDFFTYAMPVLEHTKGFIPSERIKNTHILPGPELKHIGVEDSGDWFYLAPYYETAGVSLNIDELTALRNKDGFVKKDNDWVYVPDDILKRWKDTGNIEEGRVKVSRLSYTRLRAELHDSVRMEEPPSVSNFYSILNRVTEITGAPAVSSMKGILRDYQKSGYDWLYFLYKNQLNGVLADEMGLGKTHQTMALLSAIYGNGASLPSIIVVPTSVMDHWESKLREYLPWIGINRYYDKARSLDAVKPYHVVLTTYTIMSHDIDTLSKQPWEYAVLDEAQKIKNYTTRAYKSSKLLDARHRLALTGTPIENRLTELWSIFDFLEPGYLGSLKTFTQNYDTPITKHDDAGKMKVLKKVIHPFKLRRLKSDVLDDLPAKIEDIRYCSLTAHQVSLYRSLVDARGKVLIKKLSDESKPIDYLHIFALITKLKRLCDHPSLVIKDHNSAYTSGKFELFKEIMEEAIDSGEKIVVFSQYLEMMSLIEQWLKTKHIEFSSLRGSTRNRAGVIKKFQDNPDCRVFVGSLLAGGLGIDLTSASVVIHYDRWWNAAREDQATDRVHRIGQKKSVQVFKLITRGTLEEKIDTMIKQKSILMNSIVESDDAILKKLSRAELIELLKAPA
jgi:superfamily II DNA or RNA helicase